MKMININTIGKELLPKSNVIGYSNKPRNRIRNGKETDEISIRIYVAKKLPIKELRANEIIPNNIKGYPVDIVEIGKVYACPPILDVGRRDVVRPLVSGVSVGNWCLVSSNIKINTEDGLKTVKNIRIGDKVLTHKNRFRKVTNVFKRRYVGKYFKFEIDDPSYKRTFSVTVGHPILSIKNNKLVWKKAENLNVGDHVFVETNKCKICGCDIPHFYEFCNYHHVQELNTLPPQIANKNKNKSKGNEHLHYIEDILPASKKLEKEGYKVIPIGKIIPDMIAIKDNKIYAVEVEDLTRSFNLKPKYDHYPNEISKYIDDVIWIVKRKKRRKDSRKIDFIKNYLDGFVGIKIISKKELEIPERRTRNRKSKHFVYNLEVEEDNSYVAGRVVMHNCITAGTLGVPAKYKDGNIYDISNAHVLSPSPSKEVGLFDEKRIAQPGKYDGGTLENVVGKYFWHEPIYPEGGNSGCNVSRGVIKTLNVISKFFGKRTRFKTYMDKNNYQDLAAYKRNEDIDFDITRTYDFSIEDYELVGRIFAGSNRHSIICKTKYQVDAGFIPVVRFKSEPEMGDTLRKSGRTSFDTTGEVTDDSASIRVNYGNFNAIIQDVVVTTHMCDGGDSGSDCWRKLI